MKKIILLFGGKSSEHDISIKSATNIYNNLDKNKYQTTLVYISKKGKFNLVSDFNNLRENIINFENIVKEVDIVFICLHGMNGEDGKIQSLLEIYNIPYVSTSSYSSFICIDKALTKQVLEFNNINQVKYLVFNIHDQIDDIISQTKGKLSLPYFVKPTKSGSSIGITKVVNINDLKDAIELAFMHDTKIIIEEGLDVLEVEVGIIGNKEKMIVSEVGSLNIKEDYYSFDSKYNLSNTKITIPADISIKMQEEIKDNALKIYKALECDLMARLDFFIDKKTNKIYFNELNTIPGFTNISMFPLLFNYLNITNKELLDILINIGFNNYQRRNSYDL